MRSKVLRSCALGAFIGVGIVGGLAVSGAARAEVTVELGAGIGYTNSNLLLLGLTEPARPVLGVRTYTQYNLGAWDGRREASVLGVAKGLEWGLGSARMRLSTGGSFISETNSRLSTNFEFYEQLMLQHRLADFDIALSYRHWSNANVRRPNLGMDFVGVQVEHRWR